MWPLASVTTPTARRSRDIVLTSPLSSPPSLADFNGLQFEPDFERHPTIESETLIAIQNKLQRVLEAINMERWTFAQFLCIFAQELHNGREIVIRHQYLSTSKRRRQALAHAIPANVIEEFGLGPPAVPILAAELDELITTPYFTKFETPIDLSAVDFDSAIASIQATAPTWFAQMVVLLSNQRSQWESYSARPNLTTIGRRILLITSCVCLSRAKIQSNKLPSLLDMYLLGSGVKRRVFEVLSGLGVCHSYKQANKTIRGVATHAKASLRNLAHHPQAVVVYDNINFKDTKRDEVTGHKASMKSLTTAAIVICPGLPTTGLTQSMHNPTIPLDFDDIFCSPAICGDGDEHGVAITQSLISDAIRRVHPEAVCSIFSSSQQYPQMPSIERLNTQKTAFWQFGKIDEDEGTLSGTYEVHKNIWLQQLGLRAPDNLQDPHDFDTRLWLAHGDQLTAQNIRAIKADQARAQRPYDRRDWLLGVPAWFHIQMNLLLTIVRTHWSAPGPGQEAHHCLQADLTTWGRSQGSRDSVKYHQLEPVVAQSFSSRVLAIFYNAMLRKGCLRELTQFYLERPNNISSAIASLTPTEFLDLVEDVRQSAFTIDAWTGKSHKDTEFTTMCRFLQEVELFLTVRHAVKVADIGLLRRLVDPLIIHFFGASQENYGREMLFYRWNLSSINTPELQRAILSSGLVNWSGLPNSWKPIDLSLEHLNGSCKIEMKHFKNSTHDVDITFDRVCLTNTWIRELRAKMEDTFGEDMPTTHTTASAVADIFSLARTLVVGDLSHPRLSSRVAGLSMFESEDILQHGIDVLLKKISNFNQQHVRVQGEFREAVLPSGDDDGWVDIDDDMLPATDILQDAIIETVNLVDDEPGFMSFDINQEAL